MNSRNHVEHQLESLALIKGYFLYNLNTVVASLLPAGLRRAQARRCGRESWACEHCRAWPPAGREPVSTSHALPCPEHLRRAQPRAGSSYPECWLPAAGYTEPPSGPTYCAVSSAIAWNRPGNLHVWVTDCWSHCPEHLSNIWKKYNIYSI